MAKRKKELTVTEFARMGGKALAKLRTKAERSDAARHAVRQRWAKTHVHVALADDDYYIVPGGSPSRDERGMYIGAINPARKVPSRRKMKATA